MAYSLTQEHHNFEKVLSIINIVGRNVLYWTFRHGCPRKSLGQSLRDYLKSQNWSNGEIRNAFNKTMLNLIDNDPSCSTFDISLLFTVIKKCCDGIIHDNFMDADSMEGLARHIKDLRNDAFHGQPRFTELETDEMVKHCEDVYNRLIDEVGDRYSVAANDVDLFRSEVEKEIDAYINVVRGEDEVILSLEKSFREQVLGGTEELRECYVEWSKVIPVFFLDGFDNFEVEVDAVFTEIIITDAGRVDTNKTETCTNLISNRKENIILVEGQAGSGKTTLLKFILSSWVRANDSELTIEDLEQYEFLVYFECRNRSISTLFDLISYLIPNTVEKYQMVDAMKILKSLKVLFLIDGIDEINENSIKVVQEILDFSQKSNFLTICTSRPCQLKDFYKMKPSGVKLKHLRIDGVPHDLHEVFVERLHKHLDPEEHLDTAMLVQYIRKAPMTVRKHFLFPLNLTLITALWIISPEKINRVTTVSTLYIEILDLLTEKLVERLKKNSECMQYSVDDLKFASLCAYQEICRISLGYLFKNTYVIDINEFETISKFCSNIEIEGRFLRLPVNEIMGAYLATKHTWTSRHSRHQYSYPHRSFQDHMSSEYVCKFIQMREETGSSCDLSDVLPREKIKSRHMDFFTHLIGIMAFTGEDFLRHHGVSLVDKLRIESEESSSEWWLTFLAEGQNDEFVAKACSKAISLTEWRIKDESVSAALALIKQTENFPMMFELFVFSHPDCLDNLTSLTEFISKTDKVVQCYFIHHFWHPSYGSTDQIAQCLFNGSCQVKELSGHFLEEKTFDLIPCSVVDLQIAVTTSNCLSALSRLRKLTNLRILSVNISAGLPLYLMTPLPRMATRNDINFIGIIDKYNVWLVNALLELQPLDGRFKNVCIVGVARLDSTSGHHTAGGDGLTVEGYRSLLKYMDLATYGAFNMSPILEGQQAPEGFINTSSMTTGTTGRNLNDQKNTGMSGITPFRQSSSLRTVMGQTIMFEIEKGRILLTENIHIWSFRLNEEEFKEVKMLTSTVDHKPMRSVPW